MVEKLLKGLMSPNIWRGGDPYYGVFLTTDRLIGVRGFFGGNANRDWASDLEKTLFSVGDESGVATERVLEEQLNQIDTAEAVSVLDEKKDVEVRRDNVEDIRIEKTNSTLGRVLSNKWGKLIMKTPDDKKIINIGNDVSDSELNKLKEMLYQFSGQKSM